MATNVDIMMVWQLIDTNKIGLTLDADMEVLKRDRAAAALYKKQYARIYFMQIERLKFLY